MYVIIDIILISAVFSKIQIHNIISSYDIILAYYGSKACNLLANQYKCFILILYFLLLYYHIIIKKTHALSLRSLF